ncbi:hypothetical protein [Taibaiella koreensis]|uniref:hypothetical protein n=1 Tax=Taibaiella koreensis TaxID=1268548 RepID=UPI0013C31D28|nr:hypothetical protein [Taibaiella koreensis]
MSEYIKILSKSRPYIAAVTAVAVLMFWIISMRTAGIKNNDAFYRQSFSTLVVNSKSFYRRSIEFQLGNGLKIYFMPSDQKIAVGDSIQKEANTNKYSVYRKNVNGVYDFLAYCDISDSP